MIQYKDEVAREIAEAARPTRAYFIMTGLATVLASYGLLANSPAVIIGAMLVADGTLNENALASTHVPELKATGFGDATLRQLLDMTTGIKYSENYADPKAEIWAHVRSGNVIPRPPGYDGPKSFYEFLQTVQKEGEHGQAFAYKTVNTDALGWVIRRATGKSVGENLQERIWSKLGAEQDAYFTVDLVGNEFAGGGLNAALRDFARRQKPCCGSSDPTEACHSG